MKIHGKKMNNSEPNVIIQQAEEVAATKADIQNATTDEGQEDGYIVRNMLHIPELGFSINLSGIETIDKSFRVFESVNGTGEVKPQFGIVLNKDMEKSVRYPRTNVEFWFNSEEVRDDRYKRIIQRLSCAGYKFWEV